MRGGTEEISNGSLEISMMGLGKGGRQGALREDSPFSKSNGWLRPEGSRGGLADVREVLKGKISWLLERGKSGRMSGIREERCR